MRFSIKRAFSVVAFVPVLVASCSPSSQETTEGSAGLDAAIDSPTEADPRDGAQGDAPAVPSDAAKGDAADSGVGADADADADADAAPDASSDASSDAGPPLICSSSCPAGQKYCNDLCVSIDDPTYGCGADTCAALACEGSYRTAAPKCSGGKCAVDRCYAGFADCNGTWDDGCEADLRDPATCGSCGTKCAPNEVCNGGVCAATCTFPQTNCGGRCRDISSDPAACGTCTTVCPGVHATASCNNGVCALGCDPGHAVCGGLNGCAVKLLEAPKDRPCGACNTSCTAGVGETAICAAGACDRHCLPGFSRCDGTCVDTNVEPASCGACGVVCGAGEVCLSGACAPTSSLRIVTGLGTPDDIAVDGKNIYYADQGTNEVWQVDKMTFATKLLGSNQAGPARIAIDDTYVYWSSKLGGAILRAPIDGATPPTVLYSANQPTAVAVDASSVYWADSGTMKIFKAPKVPGGPVVSLVNLPIGIGADELKIDGSRIYGSWMGCPSNSALAVYSVDKTNGTFTSLASCAVMGINYGIAIDASNAYFFNTRLLQTMLMRADAVQSKTTVPSVRFGAGALVAEDCAEYWTTGASTLWKHGKQHAFGGGTSARALTMAATSSKRLAIDETYVYWTDAGWIGRVAK